MFESHFQTEFDGGHLVLDAHRHHFRVRVRCVGELDDRGPTRGMVVDFRLLATLLDTRIRRQLEGFMLVDEAEVDAMAGIDQLEGLPLKRVPFRPTVEHLAHWCFEQVTEGLSPRHADKVESVEVWENERCMAAFCR